MLLTASGKWVGGCRYGGIFFAPGSPSCSPPGWCRRRRIRLRARRCGGRWAVGFHLFPVRWRFTSGGRILSARGTTFLAACVIGLIGTACGPVATAPGRAPETAARKAPAAVSRRTAPRSAAPIPSAFPTPSPIAPSKCYPAWEVADLRAASTVVPEQAALTIVTDYNDYRMTVTNLAAWFAKTQKTALTASSLLEGWRLQRLTGSGLMGRLDLAPPGTVPESLGRTTIVMALYAATPAQTHMVRGEGLPPVTGPMTWNASLPQGSHPSSLAGAVTTLIGQVEAGGIAGIPINVSISEPPARHLGYFVSGFGFNMPPSGFLHLYGGCPSGGGPGWTMGEVGRLIEPQWMYNVSNANGIALGLRPGDVVLDSQNGGLDVANWYSTPGIEIP